MIVLLPSATSLCAPCSIENIRKDVRKVVDVELDLCNQIELLASNRGVTFFQRYRNKIKAEVASAEIGDVEANVWRSNTPDLGPRSGSGGCSIECRP